MRVYPATVVLLPVAAFMAFSLFWDILFSPYGIDDAYSCAILHRAAGQLRGHDSTEGYAGRGRGVEKTGRCDEKAGSYRNYATTATMT